MPTCFKVHKLNFWLPLPKDGNAIKDWIAQKIAK